LFQHSLVQIEDAEFKTMQLSPAATRMELSEKEMKVIEAKLRVERYLAASKARPAKSLTIMVSPTGISLDGKPTTWDDLPALLEKVPDRPNTFLALARTTDDMTIADYQKALAKITALASQLHFKYASDAGLPPPASKK
jgi:hypothetical protein